jgi:beta-lactamase class A
VGIYARDLLTGTTYARNAEDRFPAASLFKVFVMIDLFRRAEDGNLRLGDRLVADRAGISKTGPGVIRYLGRHPELSLMDCCRLMIIWSDDVATDLLLRILTPASVSRTLAKLGFSRSHVAGDCTQMKYRMAAIDPLNPSEENDALLVSRMKEGQLKEAGFADSTADGTVTTPREMGMLLEGLYHRKIAAPAACDRMVQMMTEATANSRSMIPRLLPEGLSIAHRAGGSWRVLADAGLVDLAGRPIVISIFTHHHPAEKGAADLIADLSRILFAWSRTIETQCS